jgi:polyhydroxybutyrate depolymerase
MRSPQLFSAFFVAGACALVACSNGSGEPSGTAGTTGGAGATSAAGTGGTTSTAGTTGTAGTMATGGTTGSAGTGGTTATGGTTGNGGTGGTPATGGTTGTAGTGGTPATGGITGTGGAGAPVKSAGCGKDNADSPSQWTRHDIKVTAVAAKYTANFTSRIYYTRPPFRYDSQKPVALFVWGQGCGQGTAAEGVPPASNPLITGTATTPGQAVIVELIPPQPNHQCYFAGPDGDAPDSPELPYYDQIVSEVEAEFCIDKSRVFQGGYSSGGWFSSLVSCNRGTGIRGVGWAAAGLQTNHDPCVGAVPALITRGMMDTGTMLPAAMLAVESFRTRNGCGTTTKPWTPVWSAAEMTAKTTADTSACLSYDGCMPGYPLIWCPTPGGHTNTENDTHLTRFALWKLWTSL